MAYNALHKLNDNIAAIRIALDGLTPSANELVQLQRYSGFGGIKAILYPHGSKEEWIKQRATKEDLRLYKSIQELHELLKSTFSDTEYKQNATKQQIYVLIPNFVCNEKNIIDCKLDK